MDEVAAFLRAHPPFDALPEDDLLRLARAPTCSRSPRARRSSRTAGPQRAVWVVRSGAVELVEQGRALDPPAPGEPTDGVV